MADSAVPADVRTFLREHIESYEQLEILVLLQSRGAEAWTLSAIASELHMTEAATEEAALSLRGKGLLAVAVSPAASLYRYAPRDAEVSARVGLLALVYANQRLEIMRLMTVNAIERLRAGALRTFSNAFLFGGRKKDG